MLPEDAFRFDHVLIRDVTYAGIPKELRAELHERHADWLDGQPVGSDELVGYHLEQAYRYGAELRPVGRRLLRLAADAGERLGAAGIRAWKRGDTPATVNLLSARPSCCRSATRSASNFSASSAERWRPPGDPAGGGSARRGARDCAGCRRSPDRAARRLEIERMRMISDPASRTEELLDAATQAIPVLETFDDARSLARAWRLIAEAEGTMRCRYARRPRRPSVRSGTTSNLGGPRQAAWAIWPRHSTTV